jgi:preprotein translocase SecE subunit
MAMAVKSGPSSIATRTFNRLAIGSLAGALYVLATIAIVFYLVPAIWHQVLSPAISSRPDSPVDAALLWLVDLGVLAGLLYGGVKLIGHRQVPGLRVGIVLAVIGFYLLGILALGIGGLLERSFGAVPAVGVAVTLVIWLGLLGIGGAFYFRKGFENALIRIEDQGWLSMTSYKASQGTRMRRGTMLCVLLLVGCGVYTMLSRGTLRTAAGDAWTVSVPFTNGAKLTILNDVQFSLPILVAAFGLWLAFRLVNNPMFADFLIATEAEMNKVSWVTRRRLYQDTIVVLVTVLLLTLFMFVVDVAWFKFLAWDPIRVIIVPSEQSGKTLGPQDW